MYNFSKNFITAVFIATIVVMETVIAEDTNTDWEA
jgi:hypothetical protein